MKKNIVTFGEMMMRLSTPGALRIPQTKIFQTFFGGSEANFAVALSYLGHNVQYVTRVPNNEIGNACLMTLRQYNVATDHVVKGGNRLGSYYMETAAAMRSSKVVYDRADSAFVSIQPEMIDWSNILKDADWFHWSGIAMALSESAAKTCYNGIQEAKKQNIKLSCDLNYRKNLWKYGKTYEEVVRPLVDFSDLVFGSEDEYEHILNMPEGSFKGVIETEHGYAINKDLCIDIMTNMKKEFPHVKNFCCELRRITSSSHHVNAAVIYNGEDFYFSGIYDVDNVIDAIGVGDACAAALIDAFATYGNNYQEIIEFSMAASALKNTISGDFNLVCRDEILLLMGGNKSGRVLR